MDKNFRIRLLVAITLIVIACVSIPFFNSLPFKIFYAFFAAMSLLELLSFFYKKFKPLPTILALIQFALLVISPIFIFKCDTFMLVLIIFGVCGYDVFAYLGGRAIGGKIFKKSRPFPHISKNKTWEGTFIGLAVALLLVMILLLANHSSLYIFLLCPPLALIGDLLESFTKRRFDIKDSSEIVIKNKIFDKLEILVGGRGGHGGFLDRIDSTSFTCTVLLILAIFI